MKINMIGAFVRNAPFGTEIAFAKGLMDIGVDVAMFDPSRPNDTQRWHILPDATIIFKNAGDFVGMVNPTAPAIVYQPDDVRAPGIENMLKETLEYCQYAFTFDSTGAEVAERLGYEKAKKLIVTADPSIYRPLSIEKTQDFCFIGSLSNPIMHESRRRMVNILNDAGYSVASGGTFDPHEINKIYNQSRVVLNHACDVGQPFGEGWGYQCRHFEAGFSGACLLSNTVLGDEGDGPRQFCTFEDGSALLEVAEDLIHGWFDGPIYERQGAAFYQELCEDHLPIHRAEEIVSFIKEIE